MIWRLECLCDNVARFVGRDVIDVCETKGETFGESYDVCTLTIHTRSGIRNDISEYCVVVCVGVLFLLLIYVSFH